MLLQLKNIIQVDHAGLRLLNILFNITKLEENAERMLSHFRSFSIYLPGFKHLNYLHYKYKLSGFNF